MGAGTEKKDEDKSAGEEKQCTKSGRHLKCQGKEVGFGPEKGFEEALHDHTGVLGQCHQVQNACGIEGLDWGRVLGGDQGKGEQVGARNGGSGRCERTKAFWTHLTQKVEGREETK